MHPFVLTMTIMLLATSFPATAAPSGDQQYTALAAVEGTYINSVGAGTDCEALDLISVDYSSLFGILELSGPLGLCGWASGSLGVVFASLTFDSCTISGDLVRCDRSDYCSYAFQDGHSCYGQATIHPDGSIDAFGYDYFEEYDLNGDYAGSSGWSWQVSIDAGDALL
ncbi:MAG: hypothetical protein ACPGQL_06375 [Thermoplasmatota archaeon]